MVDPIRPKGPTQGDLRVAAVAPAASAKIVSGARPELEVSPTAQLASQLAATPPVDADRVASVKQAIAHGTFPILPATIADRLLALRYDWMVNDAA